jgi:purine nucleosidase/pyrimidine-specific ribonucleoside hydrolase
MKRVIIDTDGGVDDALALLFALASPELAIEAITTVSGNVSVDQATKNVLFLLDLVGPARRPVVARGARRPLASRQVAATHVHGEDGLGNLGRIVDADGSPRYPARELPPNVADAVGLMVEMLNNYPGEVTIITLGPLTNLARALRADSGALRKAAGIVVMGGAVRVPGNVTPGAEFNIFGDPVAAKEVFAASLPLTLVPLDVTEQVSLVRAEVEWLSGRIGGRIGTFLADATSDAMGYMEEIRGLPELFLHDPLAVGVALDPTLVGVERLHVDVETAGGIADGMTIADVRPIKLEHRHPANMEVALQVDAGRFRALFTERLCRMSL